MDTKVLIVAKTRQGSRACVGGITSEGLSVRLRAADYEQDESAGMEYEVGEVWEVQAAPAPSVIPPHVENVIVYSKRKLGMARDLVGSIEHHMPPVTGGPEALFDGLAQATDAGSLYIAGCPGLPVRSTMFWRPDQPLHREADGRRIRYRYPTADGGRSLVYVGFPEPPAVLEAGTLLRVSLAHWWRPEGGNGASCEELRCYVQLSGWFGPSTGGSSSAGLSRPPAQDVLGRGPEMGAARRLLKSVFGYDEFRSLQAEIIANLFAGHDSLAVMPTGSGKSLCYQLPALLWDGLTLVISPLISLMQDQVAQLLAAGVPAACLNGAIEYRDAIRVMRQARSGEIKLLYTSPETLLKPETLVMLDEARVACIAIDEAHCISQWGHDFRPEYRQLLPVRRRYPHAVCVGSTATATRRVQEDIAVQLGIRRSDIFIASFNRPNLYLQVERRAGGLEQMLRFLRAHHGQSGIIYCSTRSRVDDLAAQLARQGWSALPYHAGMDDMQRRRNQEAFSHDRVSIIVATIAFGMGINKSNVRFVLHYNLPESIENYYQEIGRAGRDGLAADCLLLYSQSDLFTMQKFIDEGAESERQGRRARLNAMLDYAETQRCRRRVLLEYFGERAAGEASDEGCGFCDVCRSAGGAEAGAQIDVSSDARIVLEAIRATGEMFGPSYVADLLRGSRSGKLLARGHERTPQHGAGRHQPAQYWRELMDQLVSRGALLRDTQFGSLRLTEAGRAILNGRELLLPARFRAGQAAEARRIVEGALPPQLTPLAGQAEYDPVLFEQLRVLRRELAEAQDVAPFVVFSDRTLLELATRCPRTEIALLEINGIGDRKLRRYGPRVLAAICGYFGEPAPVLTWKPEAGPPLPEVELQPESARSAEVGRLFLKGHSLAELMAAYGVQPGTIVKHLRNCVEAGWRLPPEQVLALSQLAAEERQAALDQFAVLGDVRLTPVFEALGGRVAYEELHILRLYRMCAAGVREGPGN